MGTKLELHELRGFGEDELHAWLQNAVSVDTFLRKVASASTRDFWEYIQLNKSTMKLVDAVLGIYPRQYEPETLKKYVSMRDDIKQLMASMKASVDKILLKIALEKEKVDLLFHKDMVTAASILKMAPIVDAKNNDGVLNKLLKASSGLTKAFEEYCAGLSESLLIIDGQLELLVDKEKADISPRECVFVARMIGISIDLFASIISAFNTSKSARQAIIRSHFIQGIPSFIENSIHWLENGTLEKFARPAGLCRVDRLKVKRDQLIELGTELFKLIYSDSDTTNFERSRILEQAIFLGEFLFKLNDVMPVMAAVEDLMMTRVCGHEMKKLAEECLAEVQARKAKEEAEDDPASAQNGTSKKKGYVPRTLDEFDDVKKVEIYSMVTDMHDMLPQISSDAIMEVLYHYKFDNEQTLNSLLDTDVLPPKLRKFVAENVWEESESEEDNAEASKPGPSSLLFSLKPVVPKKNAAAAKPAPVAELTPEEKRLKEKKETVERAKNDLISGRVDVSQTKDAMKLQAIKNLLMKRKQGLVDDYSQFQVTCTDGAVLVPMNLGKKKGTQADSTEEKKALKEKFATFAYVMTSEDEYDDDEWSDENEEKAVDKPKETKKPAFEVQRLNEYLPRQKTQDSSDEDEESEIEAAPAVSKTQPSKTKNGADPSRGAPGPSRGGTTASRGGRGGSASKRGGKKGAGKKPAEENDAPMVPKLRKDGYTGGKQRMMKERRKGANKVRGADRKRRGGMF